MREQHIVPLSEQAISILKELHILTGRTKYLFPNQNNSSKCMSENTILYAIYRMGYHSRATGHGFRATASTVLTEHLGFLLELRSNIFVLNFNILKAQHIFKIFNIK